MSSARTAGAASSKDAGEQAGFMMQVDFRLRLDGLAFPHCTEMIASTHNEASRTSMNLTLFDKIWNRHVVGTFSDGRALIHIDRHVLQETTCWHAFDALRDRGLTVRHPELTWSVIDHSVATHPGRTADSYPANARHDPGDASALRGVRPAALRHRRCDRQGIVHVISPELGIALPGCTLVCADSHTATSGGLGAWAWGIGTTQVLHVLATQMLLLRKPRDHAGDVHRSLLGAACSPRT